MGAHQEKRVYSNSLPNLGNTKAFLASKVEWKRLFINWNGAKKLQKGGKNSR